MKRKIDWFNHLINFIAMIAGVYLALYMSERTTKNKEKEEGLLIMNSLLIDLKDDVEYFEEEEIPQTREQLQNLEAFIQLLLSDSTDLIKDQLSSTIFEAQHSDPSSAIYRSLEASGKLSLMGDIYLQKDLIMFYEGIANQCAFEGSMQLDFLQKELIPWAMNNVNIATGELLDEGEFESITNKLLIYQSIIEQKLETYQEVISSSKELISRIEESKKSRI